LLCWVVGAAWWSMASQLAAQDYLARLSASSGLGFSGLTGDGLVPGFELLAPHAQPLGKHSVEKVVIEFQV
jgi:hypothetical protein